MLWPHCPSPRPAEHHMEMSPLRLLFFQLERKIQEGQAGLSTIVEHFTAATTYLKLCSSTEPSWGYILIWALKVQEIIEVGAEINDIENRKTIEKINQTNSWFFEKINKLDKPLARITKLKKKDLTQEKYENRDLQWLLKKFKGL